MAWPLGAAFLPCHFSLSLRLLLVLSLFPPLFTAQIKRTKDKSAFVLPLKMELCVQSEERRAGGGVVVAPGEGEGCEPSVNLTLTLYALPRPNSPTFLPFFFAPRVRPVVFCFHYFLFSPVFALIFFLFC